MNPKPMAEHRLNANAGRHPLVWRIVRHPFGLLVLGFIVFTALYVAAGLASSSVKALRNTPLQTLIVIAMGAIAIWLYRLMTLKVERSGNPDFAFEGAGRELAAGLAGGFLLFSAMAGTVAVLGGLTIDGLNGVGRLWSMLSMAIASGLFEEIIFRGIVFRHLETLAGSWIALAVTSVFFGMVHLINPDATWFAAVAIAMEAGILLGAAYMLTRRLWLACGIHAAWNFTQGWVFSAPVSGGKAAEGLLITHRSGPEWLTGGGFGLEASAVAMALATSAGLVLLVLAIRRGHYVPIPWLARRRSGALAD